MCEMNSQAFGAISVAFMILLLAAGGSGDTEETAASVAWRPLTDDADRWFCELYGMVDGIRE